MRSRPLGGLSMTWGTVAVGLQTHLRQLGTRDGRRKPVLLREERPSGTCRFSGGIMVNVTQLSVEVRWGSNGKRLLFSRGLVVGSSLVLRLQDLQDDDNDVHHQRDEAAAAGGPLLSGSARGGAGGRGPWVGGASSSSSWQQG